MYRTCGIILIFFGLVTLTSAAPFVTAVGSDGTIIRTKDGGANWYQQNLSADAAHRELRAVDFVDPNMGWTSGMFHFDTAHFFTTMRYTTNGGSSWRTADFETLQQGFPVSDLDFIDANNGWLVGGGGNIWRSVDGGLSWTSHYSGEGNGFQAVVFVDNSHGWAVSDTIVRTSDGGLTWETQHRGPVNLPLLGVDFVNQSVGWAVGAGDQILHTINGGDSWTAQLHTSTASSLRDVVFPTPNDGWIVGAKGTILHTSDAGNSWIMQASGTTNLLNAVDFINESEGWAVGESGIILHTSNGGLSWLPQNSGTDRTLHDIVAVVPEINTFILAAIALAIAMSLRHRVVTLDDKVACPLVLNG
ncbi:MAG: YCF48-related protein [Bythopirellula sp.]|nr:YCF48-related protein [Bythopirellula sp.]